MSFLEETKLIMRYANVTPDRIEWIGSADGTMVTDWNTFQKLSDFEYDSGFGSCKIPGDLIIVGDNWWLTRSEYDGSESWEFHQKPGAPKANARPILNSFKGDMWPTMASLNYPETDLEPDDFEGWKDLFEVASDPMYAHQYSPAQMELYAKQAKHMLETPGLDVPEEALHYAITLLMASGDIPIPAGLKLSPIK